MNSKVTLLTFFASQVGIYLVLLGVYLYSPLAFHFRSWEFFNIFVYNGFYGEHQYLTETGDSTRDYLVQRYAASNNVSVNEFGNRIACYDASSAVKPRVLVLGDSQLFGSGTDDGATFAAQLCRLYHVSVYDGSRRNGLSLLRVASLKFDAVLFTTTERDPLWGHYCRPFEEFVATYDQKIPDGDVRLPNPSPLGLARMLYQANKFLIGYMQSRLSVLYKTILHGPMAPATHVILERHRFQHVAALVEREIGCATTLAAFFEPKGISVGFFYFPAHQTIYGHEAGVAVDNDTASFIDRISDGLTRAGLRTMNTKACLNAAKIRTLVYQMHDTHLNAAGYRAIAECLRESSLSTLVAPDSIGTR